MSWNEKEYAEYLSQFEKPTEQVPEKVEGLEIIPADVEKTDEENTLTKQYKQEQQNEIDELTTPEQVPEKVGTTETKKENIKNKFRLKLERFSRLIADGEQFAYSKMHAPYQEQYHTETQEDIDIIFSNRLSLVSEYGDILNLLFDLTSHAVSSGVQMREKEKTTTTTTQNITQNQTDKWF